MDAELVGAYIAAATAVGCAIFSAVVARASERKARLHEARMEEFKARLEMDLKRLEAQLGEQSAEKNARSFAEFEVKLETPRESECLGNSLSSRRPIF